MEKEESLLISEMIQGEPERSMREPILALFSGLIIIGVAWWYYQLMLSVVDLLGWMGFGELTGLILEVYFAMFILGIFSGGMIILGGFIMFTFSPKAGGIITIIFSIISLSSGGGLILGLILGLLAGALALQSKKPPRPGAPNEVL